MVYKEVKDQDGNYKLVALRTSKDDPSVGIPVDMPDFESIDYDKLAKETIQRTVLYASKNQAIVKDMIPFATDVFRRLLAKELREIIK